MGRLRLSRVYGIPGSCGWGGGSILLPMFDMGLGERMTLRTEIVNDILDLGRIEAHRVHPEVVPFSLERVLGETLRLLAYRATEKSLELVCQMLPDVPDALMGDPGCMRRILVNLVGNAIKFTDGGEVVVRIAVESRTGDSTSLLVAVRDTGIGIPPEHHTRIFEASPQADGPMSRRDGGTGLGLPVSAGLVRMMGGRIWVESQPGQGSVFCVKLPFRLAGKLPAEAALQPGLPADVPILVVDDCATTRYVLQETLAQWHLNAAAVADGPEALSVLWDAAAAGFPYPVVLLDAQMPGLDGYTVADRIRSTPELTGTAVVMLEAEGQAAGQDQRSLDFAACLSKPVLPSELREAILAATQTPRGQEEPLSESGQHSSAPARRPLCILLAEDNAVNREVASAVLQRQGHTVVSAANGQQALTAFRTAGPRGFDLIVMDVQMPEMDGFEATAAIRREELATGRRTPVLALTAHALKGDRERCLNAGMDAYLAKPVRGENLLRAIEEITLVPGSGTQGAERPARGPRTGVDQIDWEAALDGVGRHADILRHAVGVFIASYPNMVAEIRVAIRDGDANALQRAAHKIKGAAGILRALRVEALASTLEAMGEAEAITGTSAVCDALEGEVERAVSALSALARGHTARADFPSIPR